MENIKEYCSRFSGITRVFKTVQAATLLKQPFIVQGFELALEFAKQDNIFKIYRYVESTALDWKVAGLKIDKDTANAQFKAYQAQADNLEKDILNYKNQQNKLSTGLSYVELGNLYLKAGDVTEAFRSYERVFNYYESGDPFTYYLQWCATMLIERRYDQLRSIAPKEAIPIDKKRREQYTTLQIFQALRCLYQGDMGEFLNIIKDNIQHDCVIEEENLLLVSNLREIGVFVTVCALARYSRAQVQEMLKSDSIRLFITQDNECLGILESYIGLDYKQIMIKLKPLFEEFAQDYIFKRFTFQEVINEKLVKQYLLPYKKVSMKKLVETLDLNQELALDYIKRLIQNNQINFLYDPIDHVLVQKLTEKSKKYQTYKRAVNVISNFLRKKQYHMIRYQLNIVNNDNFGKNRQDLNEQQAQQQGFSSFGQLGKLVGNFMDM